MKMLACQVCQNPKVTKYNHYGATNICHSCRGFFFRAVQSSMFQVFKHRDKNDKNSGGGCLIDSQSRRSCKKCRFEKCLDAGMRVAFVTAMENKKNRILMKEKLFQNVLSLEEEKKIKKMAFDCKDFMNKKCIELYIDNIELAKQHFLSELNDERVQAWDTVDYLCLRGLIEPLLEEDINQNDLATMYQHNWVKVQAFTYAIWLKDPMMFHKDFVDEVSILAPSNNKKELFLDILNAAQCKIKTITYESIFPSPWAPNAMIEDEHRELFQEMAKWMFEWQESDDMMCYCLFYLMGLLILLQDNQEVQVQEKSRMEKAQHYFANVMYKYLKSQLQEGKSCDSGAAAQFHRGLMLIHASQRAYELSRQRLLLTDNMDVDLTEIQPLS